MNSINVSDSISVPALKLKIELGDDATAAQANRAIDTVCVALGDEEASIERLRFLLGRLLVYVKTHELYKSEYATIEDYTTAIGEKHKISRSTLRDLMMKATNLPKVTPEEAEKVPQGNLSLVARAAKNATPSAVKRMLRDASMLTHADLKQKFESRGLIARRGPSREDTVTIRITVSAATAALWQNLVGEGNPADLFTDMVGAAIPARSRKTRSAAA